MPLLIATKIKVVFILPYKCGQFTVRSWIERIEQNKDDLPIKYYEMENHQFKPEFQHYCKVLVLRDPYKRFISGFLQDAFNNKNVLYKHYKGTFLDYCRFLLSIYTKKNIDYLQYENKKYKQANVKITGKCESKNKLVRHIKPFYTEISDLAEKFNHKFDYITTTENLSQVLHELNSKFNLNTTIEIGNKKPYNPTSQIDIINTSVADIASRKIQIPEYDKFYNQEIKNIVKKMYKEDFKLMDKYGLKI